MLLHIFQFILITEENILHAITEMAVLKILKITSRYIHSDVYKIAAEAGNTYSQYQLH